MQEDHMCQFIVDGGAYLGMIVSILFGKWIIQRLAMDRGQLSEVSSEGGVHTPRKMILLTHTFLPGAFGGGRASHALPNAGEAAQLSNVVEVEHGDFINEQEAHMPEGFLNFPDISLGSDHTLFFELLSQHFID